MQGISGHSVPVYLLDPDVPENSEWDRKPTSVLYGGDSRYRPGQEVVLGVGGVRMLSDGVVRCYPCHVIPISFRILRLCHGTGPGFECISGGSDAAKLLAVPFHTR